MATSSRQTKQRAGNNRTGQNNEMGANRSFLLLIGLVVAVLFVFSYLERVSNLAAVRAEVVALQDDLAQAEQRNAELEATLNEVAGSTYVDETARAELGLIQPGDDPFVVLGSESVAAGGQNETGSRTSPSVPTAEVDIFDIEWWRALFSR